MGAEGGGRVRTRMEGGFGFVESMKNGYIKGKIFRQEGSSGVCPGLMQSEEGSRDWGTLGRDREAML